MYYQPIDGHIISGSKWVVSEVFFIESKLFQLVVEEGGNFFSLKIFELGKYYMQSVFMGKSAAIWLIRNLE